MSSMFGPVQFIMPCVQVFIIIIIIISPSWFLCSDPGTELLRFLSHSLIAGLLPLSSPVLLWPPKRAQKKQSKS